jgi:protein-disulfide isomerase
VSRAVTFSLMSKKRESKPPASKRPAARKGPETSAKNYLPFIIIGVVLVVGASAGAWLWRSARTPQTSGVVAGGTPGAQPPRAAGPERAPLVLEEFGDYQCPPCGAFYPEVEQLRADYGDKLRLVFRHYPLPQAHPYALVAAHATEAAGLQGKFWEMHDRIYRTQRDWSKAADARAIFTSYAQALGLDMTRFAHDMASADVDARIVADHARGESLGVHATPTFFLNGRELPAEKLRTPADLRTALDAALAGKSF